MGISDADFLKNNGSAVSNKNMLDTPAHKIMFNCLKLPLIGDLQRIVNKMMGVDDVTFKKYNK